MERMGRAPSTFRQADLTRALKAVNAAGYSAVRIQIDKTGKLDITTTTTTTEGGASGDTDLDRELKAWEGDRGRQVSP
jgi:hypothetical protein